MVRKTRTHTLEVVGKNVVILGGKHVDIMLVSTGFLKCVCFRRCVFLMISLKSRRGKSVHGRIPWAQNSGNPCTKLIISLFGLYMCFFVF